MTALRRTLLAGLCLSLTAAAGADVYVGAARVASIYLGTSANEVCQVYRA